MVQTMEIFKYLKIAVQVVALAIFAYQMSVAMENYLQSSSYPAVETKDIEDVNLPDIFICLQEDDQFDYRNATEKHGYNYLDFLLGFVDGSEDFVSWEGGKNLTYGNVLKEIFFTILGDMDISSESDESRNRRADALEEHFKAFNGFCRKLDNELLDIKKSFRITFSYMSGFQVFIADPGKSLHYMIHPDTLQGDNILSWIGNRRFYSIEIEEIIWNEESGECTNYGTGKKFDSYADCIANEHEKFLKPILGCMVPWLVAPDHPGICKGRVNLTKENHQKYFKTIDEIYRTRAFRIMEQSKACLKPCTEILVKSTMKSFRKASNYKVPADIAIDEISLHIQKTVKVTKYVKSYGFFDLVVEVGSSLGLWIGLSALGLLDFFMEAASFIAKKIKQNV